jgi:hypothetical protein
MLKLKGIANNNNNNTNNMDTCAYKFSDFQGGVCSDYGLLGCDTV